MESTSGCSRDRIKILTEVTDSEAVQDTFDGGSSGNEILWRNQMGNEADLLFTIPIGMPF